MKSAIRRAAGLGRGVVGLTTLVACSATTRGIRDAGATAELPVRPHIVYVFTDDQRWDTLPGVDAANFPQDVFPHVERVLQKEGISFTRAYNSNPLCAPARSSLLAGGLHSHDTGVLRNQWPNGSALSLRDSPSLGTELQALGYRTAFIGKYPNGHGELEGRDTAGRPIARRHYVPPGWDLFVHRDFTPTWSRHALTIGSSGPEGPESGLWLPGDQERLESFLSELQERGLPARVAAELGKWNPEREVYVVDFERDLTLALLEEAVAGDRPWFVLLAVESPHQPAIPDDVDRGVYADYRYRGRGFGEVDLSDKPPHVRAAAERTRATKPVGPYATPDELWRAMLESLRSIDRLVGDVARALEGPLAVQPGVALPSESGPPGASGTPTESGPPGEDRPRAAALFFSSDNGYLWGEHGLQTKRWPYEESIRAPLVVRMPGLVPGVRDVPVAVDLDLPATFLALAGATPERLAAFETDGRSLLPLFVDPGASFRPYTFCESFGLEAFGGNEDDAAWASVVCDDIKVVSYDYAVAGKTIVELYDLERDPFELESRHADPSYRAALERGLGWIERERGPVVVDLLDNLGSLPSARVGSPYAHALRATGGTAPYRFSVFGEAPRRSLVEEGLGLPPGLGLDTEGRITGVPQAVGLFQFVVLVEDAGRSPRGGGPRTFTRSVRLSVEPPESPAPAEAVSADPLRSRLRLAAPRTFLANGEDQAEVEVLVADRQARPLPGVLAQLAIGGQATCVVETARTDERGVARFLVDSTRAESVPIHASVSGMQVPVEFCESWTRELVFAGDPARVAADRSVLWFELRDATADLAGVVRDRYGNPVAGLELFLEGGGRRKALGRTGADGRFTLQGVAIAPGSVVRVGSGPEAPALAPEDPLPRH